MKCNMHPYQDYSIDWILKHPYAGLFLDMGMGKTLSTLTAVTYLKDFEMVQKVLVIAPLNVAQQTWSDEIEKWSHLQHLTYAKVLGSVKERESALEEDVDIYLINRENVVWLVERYEKEWPFDMVVIDELSSFKDQKSKRFKALRKVRPRINRVVGLTGTPAPNSLLDLWPQMYLLDRGERLGKNITRYRNQYFVPDRMNGHIVYSYRLIPGSDDMIYSKIDDICVSMKAKDYLNLPKRIDNTVNIELPDRDIVKYNELEKEYVLSLDESDIVASNAAVLSNKLLQMANGAIYDEEGKTKVIHEAKLDRLEQIIDDAQGQPILVFYSYKHDLERIQKRFKQAKLLDVKGGDIEKWNNKEIPILLAHPQSAGHGLNLQAGGHIIVWFGMIWSLEFYQQANARLDRQGQTEPVIVHHLVAKGTVDELAMARLASKEVNQDALLESIKAKLSEWRQAIAVT